MFVRLVSSRLVSSLSSLTHQHDSIDTECLCSPSVRVALIAKRRCVPRPRHARADYTKHTRIEDASGDILSDRLNVGLEAAQDLPNDNERYRRRWSVTACSSPPSRETSSLRQPRHCADFTPTRTSIAHPKKHKMHYEDCEVLLAVDAFKPAG